MPSSKGLAIDNFLPRPRQGSGSATETPGSVSTSTARGQDAERFAIEYAAACVPLHEVLRSVDLRFRRQAARLRHVQELRDSETRKAAILDACPDAVITVDQQNRVLEFNAAAETLFLYRREQALGRSVVDLIVPPRLRSQAPARLAALWATDEERPSITRFVGFAMRSGGAEFPVDVAFVPIGSEAPRLLTFFVSDAAARKRVQKRVTLYRERLRMLVAKVLLSEEHERRRLATDLHDGLSQTIALTQMKLSALRDTLHGEHSGALDVIAALIHESNRAVRTIGSELSPQILHDLGLLPAVQWLTENLQARYGMRIVMEDDGRRWTIDDEARVILFRCVRELLINAAKHSQARLVRVHMRHEDDRLVLSVEDDGIGMDLRVQAVRGSGLFGTRERIGYIGGSVNITTAQGRGTRVRLCLPTTKSGRAGITVGA